MDMLSDFRDDVLDPIMVEDPLGYDEDDDVVVTTTRRALSRVAFVAAETGARFQREGIEHDPVAWLMAPRRLFDGAAAIDACLKLDAFVRATIFHGLSVGLDAEPEDVERLYLDDEADFEPVAHSGRIQHVRDADEDYLFDVTGVGEGLHFAIYERPANRARERPALPQIGAFSFRQSLSPRNTPVTAAIET